MTREQFMEFLKEVLDEISRRLNGKADEYAEVVDTFSNFRKASRALSEKLRTNVTDTDAAIMYAMKHEISINDILEAYRNGNLKERFTEDMLFEKFIDFIDYYILILGMLVEQFREDEFVAFGGVEGVYTEEQLPEE